MNLEKEHKSPMEVLAAFIVDKRNLIFFFYICAMIFSVFSQGWVHVENDITAYLPEDTETRQGLSIMEDELTTYGSARIVIAHASEELAEQLADKMAQIDGVTSAVVGTDSVGGGEEEETAEDISEYIQGSNVLISVTFDGEAEDSISLDAMDEIKTLLEPYDAYINSEVGNDAAGNLASEMQVILVIAFTIIVLVLLFTSRSYAEIPVLMITFASAALLNMGTNFIFGTISFVSNSVTVSSMPPYMVENWPILRVATRPPIWAMGLDWGEWPVVSPCFLSSSSRVWRQTPHWQVTCMLTSSIFRIRFILEPSSTMEFFSSGSRPPSVAECPVRGTTGTRLALQNCRTLETSCTLHA